MRFTVPASDWSGGFTPAWISSRSGSEAKSALLQRRRENARSASGGVCAEASTERTFSAVDLE